MPPEQRYCFDLSGYLHLRDVVTGQDLQEAQEAADRYIRMPPEEWPPGFGADLEHKDVTGYQNGFAFDKSLEQLALHPTTWPILMEFTNYRPRFTSGTLGYTTTGTGSTRCTPVGRPIKGRISAAISSRAARSAAPTSSFAEEIRTRLSPETLELIELAAYTQIKDIVKERCGEVSQKNYLEE